jgi:threonine 3-dehydrogenase
VGVNRPGAFAEYLVLPMTNVWHHHSSIDRDVASIFDPFGNAVHTALSFPVLGEDVLDYGGRARSASWRPPSCAMREHGTS